MRSSEHRAAMTAATAAPFFLGRYLLSIRRNQVVAMERNHEEHLHHLDFFLQNLTDRFHHLSPPTALQSKPPSADAPLLSLSWLHKLLDTFISCDDDFQTVLRLGPAPDRALSDYLDRALKVLDVLNAVTQGADAVGFWLHHAQIAVAALHQSPLGEGQLRRARRALSALLSAMVAEDRDLHSRSTERICSFGLKVSAAAAAAAAWPLSRSFSRPWSASRQLHAMAASLAPPRGGEAGGSELLVYSMSSVLLFVAWALVAAVPCQDRGVLPTHFASPPKQAAWAVAVAGLQERIGKEWRKKEKRASTGLMEELVRLEKCAAELVELTESIQFPMDADSSAEIGALAAELAVLCRKMEEELQPFQKKVREVFHRIARTRTELLYFMTRPSQASTPVS